MQPTKAIFGNLRLCSSVSSMTRWYFKHYHSPLAAVSISAPIKITLSAFQSFKPKKMARQKNQNKKKKKKKKKKKETIENGNYDILILHL